MRYRGFFMLRLQRKTKTRFQSTKPLAPGTRLSPRYLMVCPKIGGSLMIKKTYYDENGNPCKHWQTPEAKAKAKYRYQTQTPEYKAKKNAKVKAYYQSPEGKAKVKAYQQKPEAKAKAKDRTKTPEYKAKKNAKAKAYYQSPEGKAKIKAYHQKPEVKAKAKDRIKTPEAKATTKAYLQTPKGRALKRARVALRKAKKLQRSRLLTEAGKKVIAEIYANRPDNWHVDHIVPLQGETVSGLHLPENLQYLPRLVNCSKKNRWDNSWASHTMDTPLEEKIKAYKQT